MSFAEKLKKGAEEKWKGFQEGRATARAHRDAEAKAYNEAFHKARIKSAASVAAARAKESWKQPASPLGGMLGNMSSNMQNMMKNEPAFGLQNAIGNTGTMSTGGLERALGMQQQKPIRPMPKKVKSEYKYIKVKV